MAPMAAAFTPARLAVAGDLTLCPVTLKSLPVCVPCCLVDGGASARPVPAATAMKDDHHSADCMEI